MFKRKCTPLKNPNRQHRYRIEVRDCPFCKEIYKGVMLNCLVCGVAHSHEAFISPLVALTSGKFSGTRSLAAPLVARRTQHCLPTRLLSGKKARNPFFLHRKLGSSVIRMSSNDASPETQDAFVFGPYKISVDEVFLTTKLSFAFVNLRPVVPGHILASKPAVMSVPRFVELTAEEVTDLWLTAQRVGQKLEPYFKGSSLTLAIQDGPEAGQSVPHVHVHILPRKKADFENNDEIYDEIDKKEKELEDKLNLDEERTDRSAKVMHEEASKLRGLF